MAEHDDNAAGVEQFLKEHEQPSYLGLRALVALKGQRVDAHREDIFRFLVHRYGELPLSMYVERLGHLRELQARFQRTGRYDASSYANVPAIDGESYRVALLLSFVLTHHRFEILEALEEFLRATSGQEPKEVLSIGFGTGYELKVVHSILPEWCCAAYDTSRESLDYARDLLQFFGCPTDGLFTNLFPLEVPELPAEHRGRYGKIILCELLEHLEAPQAALRNMRAALHPQGRVFATMAINIAQEDHVYLYRTRDDAREQVLSAGFKILREFLTPATVIPFAEKNRERLFKKGNYVCLLGLD